MPQICACQQCKFLGPTMFRVFLHIWTDHLKVDIGLDKEEARELLRGTSPCLVNEIGRVN